MVSGRLFDNHAAIDLARTVFDFGAPGFWELVHSVRCAAIDAAAEHGVSLVVTTFCYAEPDDLTQYQEFEEIMQRRNGELLPVFLHCSREEAARRVGNPDRVERRKITSREGLFRDLDNFRFPPVPRSDCLKLDTEVMSADLNAQEIVRRFGLGAMQNSKLCTWTKSAPCPKWVKSDVLTLCRLLPVCAYERTSLDRNDMSEKAPTAVIPQSRRGVMPSPGRLHLICP